MEARQGLEARPIVENIEVDITLLNVGAARRLIDQGLLVSRHMILNLTSLDLQTLRILEDSGQIQRP